jgi:purine-cytosine permease-like protein
MTFFGLGLSFTFVNLLGVGLASGISKDVNWRSAYSISSGALIVAGYDGLAGFGKLCGAIIALGVIANNIPGSYSAALGVQMLGRYPKVVPRWIWTCVIVIVYFVCAVAGHDHLFTIIQNFLALMGYWITTFISIVMEEHLVFRRNKSFDWSAWEDQKRLPVGYAALTAFLVGWVGAIISMSQAYYVGPVAVLVSDNGADLGIWVGCAFSFMTYLPLRMLELKYVGR